MDQGGYVKKIAKGGGHFCNIIRHGAEDSIVCTHSTCSYSTDWYKCTVRYWYWIWYQNREDMGREVMDIN